MQSKCERRSAPAKAPSPASASVFSSTHIAREERPIAQVQLGDYIIELEASSRTNCCCRRIRGTFGVTRPVSIHFPDWNPWCAISPTLTNMFAISGNGGRTAFITRGKDEGDMPPGTEFMPDGKAGTTLVPRPSSDPHDPLNWGIDYKSEYCFCTVGMASDN